MKYKETYDSYELLLAEEGEMESVELEKMVKLVEQCLERVKSCIIRRQECPTPATSSTPLPNPKQTTVPAINAIGDYKMTGGFLIRGSIKYLLI